MAMSFDPFSQLDRFAASVLDRTRAPRLMPVDLYRVGDHYVLDADLPGVDPDAVDIDVDGQLLTIRAERNASSVEGADWLAQERPYGSYVRQFSLGDGVDLDQISANYENGVLSIQIPVSEKAKSRKIQIAGRPEKKKRLLGA